MNQMHTALISYIREAAKQDGGELAVKFSSVNDEQMVRMMFLNYRGKENARGLRLTKFGFTVMKRYFRGYEVPMPKDEKLQPLHMLYLDNRTTTPYYCSGDAFVFYDAKLAIKLKLADGRISTLIEIESDT